MKTWITVLCAVVVLAGCTKKDGLYTTWYENGQKAEEATYKNGKLISSKEWDKDGNPKASLF